MSGAMAIACFVNVDNLRIKTALTELVQESGACSPHRPEIYGIAGFFG